MAQEIHLNDVGTAFDVVVLDGDVPVDVSATTGIDYLFTKPDGTTVTKTGSKKTTGTDGRVTYVAVSGDLDQLGGWSIQVKVTLPAGQWSSQIGKFKVYKNLGG